MQCRLLTCESREAAKVIGKTHVNVAREGANAIGETHESSREGKKVAVGETLQVPRTVHRYNPRGSKQTSSSQLQ